VKCTEKRHDLKKSIFTYQRKSCIITDKQWFALFRFKRQKGSVGHEKVFCPLFPACGPARDELRASRTDSSSIHDGRPGNGDRGDRENIDWIAGVKEALKEIGEGIREIVPDRLKDPGSYREAMHHVRQSLMGSLDKMRDLLEASQAIADIEEALEGFLESVHSYYEKKKEGLRTWWKEKEEDREKLFEKFDEQFEELLEWKHEVLDARVKENGEKFKEAANRFFDKARDFIESLDKSTDTWTEGREASP